jgi:hypothetical protein
MRPAHFANSILKNGVYIDLLTRSLIIFSIYFLIDVVLVSGLTVPHSYTKDLIGMCFPVFCRGILETICTETW